MLKIDKLSRRFGQNMVVNAACVEIPDGQMLGVIGPTGAGKSVLLALMAMQFRRYENAQVFAFDFGGSIRAAAIACGGDWQDLGGSLSDDSDGGVQLQPLSAIDDPAERAWAAEWLAARWRFEKRIRMTPQELVEEAKDTRSDPRVKLLHQQRRRPQSTVGTS